MRNKYTVLAACTVAMFATGMNYVWSILQVPVMEYYGVSSGAASGIFYQYVAANVLGGLVGGRLYDYKGPQIPVILGSSLFLAGLFTSSLVPTENFWLLYVTYSGMVSFGGGIVYPCTISCAQQWWPEKRGFASGVVLSMLGASIMVFTPIINALIDGDPARVPYSFRVLCVAFGILLIGAYCFMRLPKNISLSAKTVQSKTGKDPAMRLLKSKSYYILLFCLVVAPMGYFTVNPVAMILGAERGLNNAIAVSMLMASGLAAVAGRLIFGKLCDIIGSRNVFTILFSIMTVCGVGLSFARGILFYILFLLLACTFAGVAGSTPSLGIDHFGSDNIGTTLSMLPVAVLISSYVSSAVVGALESPAGELTVWNFIAFAGSAVAGLVVIRLDRRDLYWRRTSGKEA